MIDTARSARAIEQRCKKAGNAERAVGERAYLKSDLEFYGASVWEIRRVAKEFVADARGPEPRRPHGTDSHALVATGA